MDTLFSPDIGARIIVGIIVTSGIIGIGVALRWDSWRADTPIRPYIVGDIVVDIALRWCSWQALFSWQPTRSMQGRRVVNV